MWLGWDKSKGIITDKNLSQVYSTYDSKSDSIIRNKIPMEEIESKWVHKSINTNREKDSTDETDHEESLVIENLFTNELSSLKIFNFDKNPLNRIDTTC